MMAALIRSSSWLSILPHKYGGQITEALNCEMDSLHVISKQPTPHIYKVIYPEGALTYSLRTY